MQFQQVLIEPVGIETHLGTHALTLGQLVLIEPVGIETNKLRPLRFIINGLNRTCRN